MIMVNIHEAKARLSEYVDAASRGERVMICKRNRPVAELRSVAEKPTAPRPIGRGPHAFDISASFFEPLSDEDLDGWDRGTLYPEVQPTPSRVAERPSSYGARASRKPRR